MQAETCCKQCQNSVCPCRKEQNVTYLLVQTVCISELTHEIYRGMNCNLANAKYVVESITFLMFESQTCTTKQVFSMSDSQARAPVGMGTWGLVHTWSLTLSKLGGVDYAYPILY